MSVRAACPEAGPPADEAACAAPAVARPDAPAAAAPARRSLRALDAFVFFVADLQTGFGPFVAVYLTTQKWTQVDIGLVLTVGGLVSLIGQMPGGALVDAVRSVRGVAAFAAAGIGLSALAYAMLPLFPIVLLAASLHAASSCVLGPAIAAVSLGLVGYAGIGERLGRNARFAAVGTGLSAAAMGTFGYLLSARSVFLVTAALALPILISLWSIRARDIDRARAQAAVDPRGDMRRPGFVTLLRNRSLLVFGLCIMLFHLANAAMLPLMGSVLTTRSSQWAPALIAACMVVPQLVVAVFAPSVGRSAQRWGRRPLLIAGFAMLPLRAALFATVADPHLVIVLQVLDGLTAAVFSVMVPLTIADLTRGSGRFNLTQGIVGTATGIGASLSPTMAGYIADHYGSHAAFLTLAGIALAGLAAVAALMPETRPEPPAVP